MNQSSSIGWWRRDAAIDQPLAPVAGRAVAPAGGPWAFRGLLAFTVVLILSPQSFIPALAPLRIAFLAGGMALVSHAIDRWGHGFTVPGGLARETVLAGCLLVWSVVTIPLSIWPGGSAATLTEIYIKSLIVFWLLGQVVSTVPRLRTLLWTLSILTVPLALTGVKNYASGIYMTGGDRILGYAGGLTTNPNDMALMLDMLIPITVILLLNASRWPVRVAMLGVLAVSILGVIVTFSRAGFLALAFEGVLFIFVLIRRRAWVLAGAAVLAGVLVAPLLPPSYIQRLSTVTDINSDPTGSAQERWRDTLAALQYFRAHPVTGAGLGMDILALNEVRGAKWRMVHDTYLVYAVDLGAPGLILFVVLLTSTIWTAWSVERHPVPGVPLSEELSKLASGIRVSLVAYAAAVFFYPTAYHFYFYYMAGLALALRTCRAALTGSVVAA
jgi:O-antigen ligase